MEPQNVDEPNKEDAAAEKIWDEISEKSTSDNDPPIYKLWSLIKRYEKPANVS